MFERFSQDARAVVIRGRDEAIRAGQNQIGSEHLVLGMLAAAEEAGPGPGGPGPGGTGLAAAGVSTADLRSRLPGGSARRADPLDAEALASIGIDLDAVQRASDASFGPGSLDRVSRKQHGRNGFPGRLGMTTEAKQALELALRIAVRRKDGHISSGHLLLGIIDRPGSSAVALLRASDVDVAELRADLLRRMTAAA